MRSIVIDSDILIDHLRHGSDLLDFIFLQVSQIRIKVYLPAIVFTEICSGKDTKIKDRLELIGKLLQPFEFVAADKKISQLAGFLIRDNQGLKLGDAIVAATAIELNAKLATRNVKDFDGIKGIKFFKVK